MTTTPVAVSHLSHGSACPTNSPAVTTAEGVTPPAPSASVVHQWIGRFLAWAKDFFGPVEFTIAARRGLSIDDLCVVCRRDVHDDGEVCPEQFVGDCSTCGQTVLLDYYRNCIPAGDHWRYHPITNQRSAVTLKPEVINGLTI